MRPARLGYEPALDGVRAVAVLSVLAYHAVGVPKQGFLGVDIFFVLSGFLITTLLVQEWQARGTISLRRFYARRALRLFPALAVVVLAFLGGSVLLFAVGSYDAGQLGQAAESVGYGLGYVSNVVRAWHWPTEISPALGHLWSLAEEEQFYLVWPLVLVLCLRRRFGPRTLMAIVLVPVALIALHRLQLTIENPKRGTDRLYFAPDTRFDPILVGSLAGLAYAFGRIPRALTSPSSQRTMRLALPPFVTVVLLLPLTSPALYGRILFLFEPAVAILLVAVLLEPTSRLARWLAWEPLVLVGKISYGVYLWHLVMFSAFGAGIGFVLTFVAAAASYRYVELPFLRRKRRLAVGGADYSTVTVLARFRGWSMFRPRSRAVS